MHATCASNEIFENTDLFLPSVVWRGAVSATEVSQSHTDTIIVGHMEIRISNIP